jgi:hypothetical protein
MLLNSSFPQTALLAGVQASLTSILSGARGNDDDIAWKVAVWFNYAGIYFDVGATLSAVYVVQWAAGFTADARTLAKEHIDSLPAQVLRGKLLKKDFLTAHHEMELLRAFGMPRHWEFLAHHMMMGLVLGAINLSVTLTILVFKTEGIAVSASLVVALVLGMLPVGFYVRGRLVPVGVMAKFKWVDTDEV